MSGIATYPQGPPEPKKENNKMIEPLKRPEKGITRYDDRTDWVDDDYDVNVVAEKLNEVINHLNQESKE